MDIYEAIRQRHSVRSYQDKPIPDDVAKALESFIVQCNRESGLHIQLVRDERKAFDSFRAHYGRFSGVSNYIALIGPDNAQLDEKCGYYGEKVVLEAQRLGLNTCWVALTYKKVPDAYVVFEGEKLDLVISLGYGNTQGVQHRSKSESDVSNVNQDSPKWFKDGVRAALLAPTAINQQKFYFELSGDKVIAKSGLGPCSKIDLGIVKCHFEIGSGKGPEIWK